MLDAINRGRNLGPRDMNEKGLTSWDVMGPRATASNRTFVNVGRAKAAVIQLLHCNRHLINFSGSFSLAVWVKIKDESVPMPIFEWKSDTGVDFWFYPSNVQDQLQLYLAKGHEYNSKKNNSMRLSWRHVAAVYKKAGDVQFYFNAHSLGVLSSTTKTLRVDQPNQFNLGRFSSEDRFFGSMACLTIYERALTQAEVRLLMNECP